MTLLTVNGIVWTKINNEWLSSTNEVIINPSQIVSISQIKNRGFGDGNYLANKST